MKKILIASANPYSFCIAVERYLASSLGDEAQVDGINLYALVSRFSPFYRRLSIDIAEGINRKYDRFVRPVLSGKDLTAGIRLDGRRIPPMPRTVAELRAYEVDGAKVGLGVLSSMITLTTIQDAVTTDEYGPNIRRSWRAAHLSLQAGLTVRDMDYDEVYLFNGRQCYTRPFRDILERSTRVIKYEVGGCEDTTAYVTSETSLHEASEWARLVEDSAVDVAEGEAFYRDRMKRVQGNEVNYFIGIQKEGQLPAALAGENYVAFFTSSADERIAALGRHDLGEFRDQSHVALTLARLCAKAGVRLAVRLHPHLRYKDPSWRKEWDFDAIRQAGGLIIEPDASFDSYAVAKTARCVVTAGSTISFECSFLNVPNAVVGDCVQGRLGSSAICNTEAELAAFIADPKLPEQARGKAIMYGSYMRVGGIPLPRYELRGHISRARMDGRVLDPVRRLLHPLRRLLA